MPTWERRYTPSRCAVAPYFPVRRLGRHKQNGNTVTAGMGLHTRSSSHLASFRAQSPSLSSSPVSPLPLISDFLRLRVLCGLRLCSHRRPYPELCQSGRGVPLLPSHPFFSFPSPLGFLSTFLHLSSASPWRGAGPVAVADVNLMVRVARDRSPHLHAQSA